MWVTYQPIYPPLDREPGKKPMTFRDVAFFEDELEAARFCNGKSAQYTMVIPGKTLEEMHRSGR